MNDETHFDKVIMSSLENYKESIESNDDTISVVKLI